MTTTIHWSKGVRALSPQAEAERTGASGAVSAAGGRQGLADSSLTLRAGVLESALDRALRRLQEGLAALDWSAASGTSFPGALSVSSGASGLLSGTASADAAAGTHSVRVTAAAQDSLFASSGFDPDASTTLAPGTYTLDWSVGAASDPARAAGQAQLVVNSGDTWSDVLARMARTFGSASPALVARLVPAKRVWTSADGSRREPVDAARLEIGSAVHGAAGRLRLSGADAASAALLKTLGLDATARPGADAHAVVDGVAQTSATGDFTADGGSVALHAAGSFGAVEQIRVSGAASTLADGLSGVLAAYNDVLALLTNETLVRGGLAEDWRGPAAKRAAELDGVGVERSASGALWLDGERFLAALYAAPERVRGVLAESGGLLPELAARAARDLSGGARELLVPEARDPAADPVLEVFAARREGDAARAGNLLDLYDESAAESRRERAKEFAQPGWTGVLHVKG
jgi:hypothetical protein